MVFYILAYITGGLVVLTSLLSYIFPKRSTALILKFSVDFCATINQIFIYFATNDPIIFAAVATNTIACIRDVTYMFKGKNKFTSTIWCPLLFASLALLSLIFTYKSPISLLPAIGSFISAMTLFLTNQKYVKIGGFFGYSFYSIYYFILLSQIDNLTIFTLISALAAVVSTIVGFIVIVVREKNQIEPPPLKH